ncbi:copper chaperone PCu(A)C [Salipiger sp. P9]|uniref:copper chaperone PCu(A)C n=1 Tax=Salipiger pentaromativorans TaxID=2943193 RepID=UPI002158946C|nr:copper chaperone PCu(A)C [Salipiger pentaromativorans]MCR8550665.1 copper chaperone PCu(A)C [Salipiger pentaromativorans]
MKSLILAGAAALALCTPAVAEIVVQDAYARSSMMGAKTGAAFMVIENTGDEDDRLVSASSDAAMKVELHTHIADDNGIMRMVEVEEGFAVPAHSQHLLQRGGDHVMFMGLTAPFEQDKRVTVTLTFEKAGEMVVEIPVDLERRPMHNMQHGTMGGMKMQNGAMSN